MGKPYPNPAKGESIRTTSHHAFLNRRIGRVRQETQNLFSCWLARNASSFVRDFNDDIFIVGTVGNNHLNGIPRPYRAIPPWLACCFSTIPT
jgi:hypothetical protein